MGRTVNSGLSVGAHGQASLENYELMNFLNEQKSQKLKKELRDPIFMQGLTVKYYQPDIKDGLVFLEELNS